MQEINHRMSGKRLTTGTTVSEKQQEGRQAIRLVRIRISLCERESPRTQKAQVA